MTIVHQNKPAQESLSDTAKYIYEFYRRDDISSVNPGRKEVRTVLNQGVEKPFQKIVIRKTPGILKDQCSGKEPYGNNIEINFTKIKNFTDIHEPLL